MRRLHISFICLVFQFQLMPIFVSGRNLQTHKTNQTNNKDMSGLEKTEAPQTVDEGEYSKRKYGIRSTRERSANGDNPTSFWPVSDNGHDVFVPFVFDTSLEPEVKNLFLQKVNMFAKNSCVRWIPKRPTDVLYVTISSTPPPFAFRDGTFDPNRCFAFSQGRSLYNAYNGMYLTKLCLGLGGPVPYTYVVDHEMMHVLNFIHEHQRNDRDCFITVDDSLVQQDTISFDHFSNVWPQGTDESYPYDENSVMQYPEWRTPSLRGKQLGPIGDGPSYMDWMKINNLYCGGPHYCDLHPKHCQEHQEFLDKCKRAKGAYTRSPG